MVMGPGSMDGRIQPKKHACTACSRRKIRCDRRQPCGNCLARVKTARRSHHGHDADDTGEHRAECVYIEPAPAQRHRRRRATPSAATADTRQSERLRLYEDLLRQNGIAVSDVPPPEQQSQPQTKYGNTIWIASPWQSKVGPQTPASSTPETIVAEAPAANEPQEEEAGPARSEMSLWSTLPPELRNPPVSSVFRRSSKREPESTGNNPSTATPIHGWLQAVNTAPAAHPEPRIILRLWQVFADSVHPLMRFLHVPTVQQQIGDASWNAANAQPETAALMFSVYSLALIQMPAPEYDELFENTTIAPKTKAEALQQFQAGAAQALLAAGLLTTSRLDVLQAFTLFILAEADMELAGALAAIAMHLAHKMGLHTDATYNCDSGLSFFDKEMRVRLWWQIRGIDARLRQAASLTASHHGSGSHGWLPSPDPGDVRLPLNVNDVDLHPEMTGPPCEHSGPTEMLYVLMKYEAARWIWGFTRHKFSSTSASRPHELAELKDRAIDELEELFENKYLKQCDEHIPLHALTASMARNAVAQLRFQVRHPRVLALTSSSGILCQRDADAMFSHGVRMLELSSASRSVTKLGNSFAAFQMLADMVMRMLVEAVVYVISVLRVRTDRTDACVVAAWRVVERFYGEYEADLAFFADESGQSLPESRPDVSGKSKRRAAGTAFVAALGDLTLEAWEAWEACHHPMSMEEPAFVTQLRSKKNAHAASHMAGWDFEDPAVDWENWTDFLQF